MSEQPQHATIKRTNYRPSDPNSDRQRVPLWQWTLAGLLMIVLLTLWFLFTAKSVVLSFSPKAEEISIQGGIHLKLGSVFLMREGTYTVAARTGEHKPLERSLRISAASNQSFQYTFTPNPGVIELTRIPSDAQVFIDGTELELTANATAQFSAEAGLRQLQLRHPNYLTQTVQVDVTGKSIKQSVSVELTPAWANVKISSEPDGAEIWIDNQSTGQSTPAQVEVMQGERQIRLQKPGFKTYEQRILAVAGTPQTIAAGVLTRADAQLQIATTPSNAALTVNGIYQGQTPLQIDLKSKTKQTVQAVYPGHAAATQSLTLASGETRTIKLELTRMLGEVRIETRPQDALVTINDQPITVDKSSLELPLKPQRISVTRPGYAGFETVLNPRAGLVQELKVKLLTLEEARLAALIPVINNDQGHTLRLFNADTVAMGASRREPGRRANETMRQANFDRLFYLAEREVTNAQFRAFASGHDSGDFQNQDLNDDDQPAVNVGWHEAANYCNWLSKQDGLSPFYAIEFGKVTAINPSSTGYRLPTEAEWAWAARRQASSEVGKTSSEQLKFPWGDALPPPERFANYADRAAGNLVGRIIFGYNDNHAVSAPVGTFSANSHGLYDLGSNVAEWTHDYYEIPDQNAVTDHLGPEKGEFRVIKGASWMHGTITELRLSFRDYGIEGREDLGFRIARYAE
jgi:formylglycine-generating enzyme required for sulfatase activity